jgi:hypothetical protein
MKQPGARPSIQRRRLWPEQCPSFCLSAALAATAVENQDRFIDARDKWQYYVLAEEFKRVPD